MFNLAGKVMLAIISVLLIVAIMQRIDILKGNLAAAIAARDENMRTANQNMAVLERIKSDYNTSLNMCFGDYKKLSDSYDRYRVAIAKPTPHVILNEVKNLSETTCKIGENSAIVDALNQINTRAPNEFTH
ncbi:hypothetical protein FACS189487_10930 [Campylobacterota bacterium]|nr:hypothetical protein FACS189487_10930 [Campylobacterota bacterium]